MTEGRAKCELNSGHHGVVYEYIFREMLGSIYVVVYIVVVVDVGVGAVGAGATSEGSGLGRPMPDAAFLLAYSGFQSVALPSPLPLRDSPPPPLCRQAVGAATDLGGGPDDAEQRGVPGADGEGGRLPRPPTSGAECLLRQVSPQRPHVVSY